MNSVNRFSNRADSYARHRPRYPQEVVDCLVQRCGLTSSTVVAEIGAGGFTLHEFPNFQVLDWEGLAGRLTSTSYVPAAGEAGFEPMMEQLHVIFAANAVDGAVVMQYDTHLYAGQMD